MILDLERTLPEDQRIYDVCIVGAGAAGISLAVELRRKGKAVVILEGGGPRFERRSQALYSGQNDGLPYAGLIDGRFRVLGGSTTQWGGQVREISEHVFGSRPWTANKAWPFPKAELQPYYQRALEIEGLESALATEAEIWASLGLNKPDFGPDFRSVFSRWCPQRNFAVLHAETLNDQSVTIYLHANLESLNFAEDGETVRAVRCRSISGTSATFKANNIVLCVGGIETSRFLLQSAAEIGIAPWRSNSWVGRGYQDHIVSHLGTVVDCNLKPLAEYFDYRVVRGYRYHHRINLSAAAQERLGVLDIGATLSSMINDVDHTAKAFGTLRLIRTGRIMEVPLADLIHFARHLAPLIWQKLPISKTPLGSRWEDGMMRLCIHCEQTVASESKVTLTDELNALGQFQPRVTWRVGDHELQTIRAFASTFCKAFSDNGYGRIILDPGIIDDDEVLRGTVIDSLHHIGGARMASSAEEGVVDADLKLFGTTNAYVCSSAVFPSAGYVNPTHTIIALAVRLAEHLASSSTP